MYQMRCGTAVSATYNGETFSHQACHTNDAYLDSITGQHTKKDGTKGWHDAGDYNKYVVNAGVTVGTLLAAFEMFPEKFLFDDLNIPESGNGIPDILDETKFELDWLFKMQRADGAVFAKVTHTNFEGFIMPQNDGGVRYIYQVASTATADFAAMMARAYRAFLAYDKTYADKCLAAAKKSWNYLTAHPQIFPAGGFKNPTGTATGQYGDGNDTDERLWAAAELFLSTNEAEYNSYFTSRYTSGGTFNGAMSWPNLRTLAQLTYLFGDASKTDASVVSNLKSSLINYCNTLVGKINSDGFNVVLGSNEYYWGCNSDVLNKAILLIAGYTLNGDQKFYDAAVMQMNYILGTNAHNISFITGVGENSIMHPHHRPSGSDGIVEPVPGLIAGGPDQNRSDSALQQRFSATTPHALCFVDHQDSYASNEICINWNAPMVFVAGYLNNGIKVVSVDENTGGIPTNFKLDQNYPNSFNPSTTIGFSLNKNNSFPVNSLQHVVLKIYDTLGREMDTLIDDYKSPGTYEGCDLLFPLKVMIIHPARRDKMFSATITADKFDNPCLP